MITQERRVPYDRPNLSKGYLSGEAGPDSLPWRDEKFYQDYDIELLFGRQGTGVDVARKTIAFAEGPPLTCDGLVLATAVSPNPSRCQEVNMKTSSR